MAKRLSPSEKAYKKFDRLISTKMQERSGPKGQSDCREYGIQTYGQVFTKATTKIVSLSEKVYKKYNRFLSPTLQEIAGPIGYPECKEYGIQTWCQIFSNELRKGSSRYNCRKREQKQNKIFEEKNHLLFLMFKGLPYKEFPKAKLDFSFRFLGSLLFELPTRFSGFESKECLRSRKEIKGFIPTEEHFYPRKWAGELIIRHILRYGGIKLERFKEYCDVLRQIHKTTKSENQNLDKYHKISPFLSWQLSYREVGIDLIRVKETKPVTEIEEVIPPQLLRSIFGKRLQ